METIAVFVDDAGHARQLLAPMLGTSGSTRWVVVGCAPRLSHRIGKWLSHAAREQWRERWMAQLRRQMQPTLAGGGERSCEWLLARGPLDELAARLRGRHGTALRLLDARLPLLGVDHELLIAGAEPPRSRWTTPVAVSSSLAVVLALTD